MRFFRNCPYVTIIVIISLGLFLYGLLLSGHVIKAANSVNLDNDPETVGVATAMQDIKARLQNLMEGINDRDYTIDYTPTEYVPDDDIIKAFGVDDKDSADADDKAANSGLSEKDAEAAKKRAERSERMKNGEAEDILKEALKTELPEGDQSSTGDSYDGFYTVGEGYFTGGDTVIIGDSREQGFGLYSGLPGIVSYAQKSYGVHQVFTKKWIDSEYGKLTLEEAMAANKGKFRKIYIMFGLNEMGWADENTFDNAYYQLIDMLKYYQPNAVIYVQSIINVTRAKDAESNVFNNSNIGARNEALRVVAEKEHVAYLDLNYVLADEEGFLPDDFTSDGIHMKQKYMYLWVDFLKSHAVLSGGSDSQYVAGYGDGYTPPDERESTEETDEAGEEEEEDETDASEDTSEESTEKAGGTVTTAPVDNSNDNNDKTSGGDWETGGGLG